MKHTISNGKITFVSSPFNVEPWKLGFNGEDVNYFWHPEAPEPLGTAVCFPLLGVLPDNKYLLDGKEYPMGSHGFAGERTFETVERSATSVTYELREDGETLAQYPYRFVFQVVYRVEDCSLKTEYRVKNRDTRDMYFSVGGHPRFACPIGGGNFEDYHIEFEKAETIQNIVKSYGPVEEIAKRLSPDGKKLYLDYGLFTRGCFCFHPLNSSFLTLKNGTGSRGLRLRIEGLSHFQLWTAPGGPFIALEPWYGSTSSHPPRPSEGRWKDRPGTLRLSPGEELVRAWYADLAR